MLEREDHGAPQGFAQGRFLLPVWGRLEVQLRLEREEPHADAGDDEDAGQGEPLRQVEEGAVDTCLKDDPLLVDDAEGDGDEDPPCLLYTSPSPRD